MNYFKYWHMKHETSNAKIKDYLPDEFVIVEYKLFKDLNSNQTWWKHGGSKKWLQRWLTYTSKLQSIWIPNKIVNFYSNLDQSKKKPAIMILKSEKIHGMLLLDWNNSESINNNNELNGNKTGMIVARGLFDQPIPVQNINPLSRNGLQYVTQINSKYLTQQPKPTPYHPNLDYDCGITVLELSNNIIGDTREIWTLCGWCQGSAKYPCFYCIIKKSDIAQQINANNRDHEPRLFKELVQWSSVADRNILDDPKFKSRAKFTYGVDHCPLYYFSPHQLCIPGIHMRCDQHGKTLYCCKGLITHMTESNQNLHDKLQQAYDLKWQYQHEVYQLNQIIQRASIHNAENIQNGSLTPNPPTINEIYQLNNNDNSPYYEMHSQQYNSIHSSLPPPKYPVKSPEMVPSKDKSGSIKPNDIPVVTSKQYPNLRDPFEPIQPISNNLNRVYMPPKGTPSIPILEPLSMGMDIDSDSEQKSNNTNGSNSNNYNGSNSNNYNNGSNSNNYNNRSNSNNNNVSNSNNNEGSNSNNNNVSDVLGWYNEFGSNEEDLSNSVDPLEADSDDEWGNKMLDEWENELQKTQMDLEHVYGSLEIYKNLLKKAETDYNKIKNEMDPHDTKKYGIWNKVKDKLGIQELTYRNHEVTGPNGIKLMNKWNEIVPYLKKESKTITKLAIRLFYTQEFLTHFSLHKNTIPFSDMAMDLHKFATIQNDTYCRLFYKAIKDKGINIPFGMGTKHHFGLHESEKMRYTRQSTGQMDEQIPEGKCKQVKFAVRAWNCVISMLRTRALINRLNSEHSLRLDKTGKHMEEINE